VNPFWLIDEASFAEVRGAQPGIPVQPSGAGTAAPFLTQIEQVLGEETEPDAAFFMDSWTVGVAAASESFLRRQQERNARERASYGWDTLSFTPFFVARVEAPAETAWPREAPAEKNAASGLRWRGDEEPQDSHVSEEFESKSETRFESGSESFGPLTVESACHLLGVTTASTRDQIRAAYRKMASRYHPDRLARNGAREQKQASDRMASINEAYSLLCAELVGPWSPCRVI
jgi:DnaJ-domain-containing protein 1